MFTQKLTFFSSYVRFTRHAKGRGWYLGGQVFGANLNCRVHRRLWHLRLWNESRTMNLLINWRARG